MPTLLPRGRREPSPVMRPAGTRVGGRRAGLVAAAGLPQPEHGAVEPDQPWWELFRCSTGSCVSTPSEEDHRRRRVWRPMFSLRGARAWRQPDPVAGLDQTEVLRVDADAMPAVGVPECRRRTARHAGRALQITEPTRAPIDTSASWRVRTPRRPRDLADSSRPVRFSSSA